MGRTTKALLMAAGVAGMFSAAEAVQANPHPIRSSIQRHEHPEGGFYKENTSRHATPNHRPSSRSFHLLG